MPVIRQGRTAALHHAPDDWQTYVWSLGSTFVGAAVFTWTRTQDHRVPQEALIGIVYVAQWAGLVPEED